MTSTKLIIQPQPSNEQLNQQFAFIGSVDVDAIPVLEPLYILPENCAVALDFAKLDRINSMGLAQLLKLFEHWQKRSITIKITNVNRMISVLFKMTGLTRFLADIEAAKPTATARLVSTQPQPVTVPTEIKAQTAAPSEPVKPKESVAPVTASQGPLHILPTPSAEAKTQTFNFIGTIDVGAIAALETLYILPPDCTVKLDFIDLLRINSMGLAQLLKLFEHWQKQNISINIVNVNRMITVLFKMTGLMRFIDNTDNLQAASTPSNTQQAAADVLPEPTLRKIDEAITPVNPAVSVSSILNSAAKVPTDKLNLWVSAQNSQQMNGWYFFNTYLQRHLGREIHLELNHGAITERRKNIHEMDIVFTKPFEATRLLLDHNFQAILRPLDQTDEVTLLVRASDERQKPLDFKGGKVVTSAQESFVYLLGRFLLEQDEEALEGMDYVFSGHDIKALQMLLKEQADILFMLSETYQGLSGLTKKMLRQIDQSETAFAFHLFSVAPSCQALATEINEVLLNMSLDSQGRQVLLDLGISGWVKPTDDEIAMLTMLFQRYANEN